MARDGKVILAGLAGSGNAAAIAARLEATGVTVVPFDPAMRGALSRQASDALSRYGRIDAIFFALRAPPVSAAAGRLDPKEFDEAIGGGLKALFLAMGEALPVLIGQGDGVFVLLADGAAVAGIAGDIMAATDAHAALGLMRAAALDVAASGVRVNMLCASRSAPGREPPAEAAAIADMVAFLASPTARSVTGAHFMIDGAQTAALNTTVPFLQNGAVHAELC